MSGKMQERAPVVFEPPPIQTDAQRYWEAAAEGVLLVKRCEDCGQAHFYPRQVCPFCSSRNTVWVESCGFGQVYSLTVVRRGLPEPQAIAYVTLDEGPTVIGKIEIEDSALSIGQRVRAGFVQRPGERPFMVFRA